jgi:hypothetical protein
MNKWILGISFFVSSLSWGAEVAWINLTPYLRYQDISVSCSTEFYPYTRYLAMEIENGTVTKAVVHRDLGVLGFNPFIFSQSEAKAIKVVKNENGDWRLSSFPLSARTLVWFFFHAGSELSCIPPMPLKTIIPYGFEFTFESSFIGPYSNLGKFRGQRKDGGVYNSELEFLQEPFRP